VILPGYADHDPGKTEVLLRKAIRQVGLSPALAENAELEWRRVGFLPGLDLATRYVTTDHLKRFPKFHVRVRWRDQSGRPVAVRGPFALGAGRYCGFGLFAVDEW
jgi:CRISPR-associated protein Csb2